MVFIDDKMKCPECGGNKFGKGETKSEGRIYPINKFFTTGSAIIHVICISCGYIVKSIVENPHKFEERNH